MIRLPTGKFVVLKRHGTGVGQSVGVRHGVTGAVKESDCLWPFIEHRSESDT